MLDSRPAVSVVIPARDAAAYLPDALGSLARQGPGGGDLGDQLEVVVVDDGSVDDTADVLEDAGSHLARLDVGGGRGGGRGGGGARPPGGRGAGGGGGGGGAPPPAGGGAGGRAAPRGAGAGRRGRGRPPASPRRATTGCAARRAGG
jgi:glycosyltransferase involved in cell wall biosynthesis